MEHIAQDYEEQPTKDLKEYKKLHTRVRETYKQNGIPVSIAACDLNIAKTYTSLKKKKKAEKFFNLAKSIYLEKGIDLYVEECDKGLDLLSN